ncbi:hypothetical protein GM418_10835 [Maribellus comscasis]|uniref:Uncharacterized protein n=1 Tax=Maribellus comscasis TaxID=2681766 RepID=A0A6I6JML4_9BACT|nr:hypothetical protein [Maribellus comscasis]QGY44135.1 hypothetical protein GM418_10835 [Maribellus comscasis]
MENVIQYKDGTIKRYVSLDWHPVLDSNPYAIGCEVIDKATSKLNDLGIDLYSENIDDCVVKGSIVEVPYNGGFFVYNVEHDMILGYEK